MPAMFLLIGNYEKDDHWCKLLRESLAPLGQLEVQGIEAALECLLQNCYDLIIVEDSAIGDLPQLLRRLTEHRPGIPIIVISASPTWLRARNAFRTGATDYIRKSFSKRELFSVFRDILARVLPS